MIEKYGTATWYGGLKDGQGQVSTETGSLLGHSFSWAKRFGDEKGTNPEELIGAAHAACFAMALSSDLGKEGLRAESIEARSTVTLDTTNGADITKAHIDVTARVPGASDEQFQRIAEGTSRNCPVSKLLKGSAEVSLTARLG